MSAPTPDSGKLREAITLLDAVTKWAETIETVHAHPFLNNRAIVDAREFLSDVPIEEPADGTVRMLVDMPADLNAMTRKLVKRFASALAEKLHKAEQKYGYGDGWLTKGWIENGECARKLHAHAAKGDPRDVAAYCAFLWYHGASTALPATSVARKLERQRDALKREAEEANATCAELVTDGNAITLAANLAKKSQECSDLRAIVARLSPDVVLKVVEALEAAKERIGQKRQSNYYAGAAEADVIDYEVQTKLFDALALLNAPNRDPK